MTSTTNSAQGGPSESFPEYFKKLSADYARQTGNSTRKVIERILQELQPSVTPSSIIHDNACGPGTATTAIISHIGHEPSLIEATDFSPGMVDTLLNEISTKNWKNVRASVMDSHELTFPDNTFTVSITNVSISTFQDPLRCLREVHRTLRLNGLAVVSTWKRFAVSDLIHTAQQAVRPDAQLVKVPRAEFMEDGYLQNLMAEAGFPSGSIQVWDISTVIQGQDSVGLREFMLGGFTASARAGWTDEEHARWEGAIDSAIAEEQTKNSGIKMEAWVVTAKKQ
ncbi:hypothetical protein LTR28_009403 [Elasticomyces elasticus]|nr:hypothetical protein LTR28_009403 [Elasticomyces elasticus]